MLNLNITSEEKVMESVTKTLSAKVRGAYMDFDNSSMYVLVDFYDESGKVYKAKQICVNGAFYESTNSDIANDVLTKIEAGVTAILSEEPSLQPFVDVGEIKVKEVPVYPDDYYLTQIEMERSIESVLPPEEPIIPS